MISQGKFIDEFGAAAYAGNASLLVGAGLSRAAGLPDWQMLMKPLRRRAGIPAAERDLPLVAEYFQNAVAGGRAILEAEIASRLATGKVIPTAGFQLLSRLPIQTFWTTNFDNLLEQAVPSASVLLEDDDLKERSVNGRRIIKMHGSLSDGSWESRPVISRRDYEEYERRHPRMWAELRATYLTKAMLFLGFSFDDPNVEVLLRLVRNTVNLGAPEHFTILRRPGREGAERMAHEHRVRDLENSGVSVVEIDTFDDLEGILAALVRRTRPLSLFVAGSETDAVNLAAVSGVIAQYLADTEVTIESLSGQAAKNVKFAIGERWIKEGRYNPRRLVFNYRQVPDDLGRLVNRRIGTIVFAGEGDKREVRERLIDGCRAVLVLGGGDNTSLEVAIARQLGVPVIPVASTGGAALKAHRSGELQFESNPAWRLLGDPNPQVAGSAAVKLLRIALSIR